MFTVSVVIPAYNAEAFIRSAIESALSQTLPVHEVLVIDDGSQDQTPQIVASYGKQVRLISQPNGGPSSARNHGAQVATGEYIAFLDADDRWSADKLERQAAAMQERPEAVLCYTSLLMLLPDGSEKVEIACPEDRVAEVLRIYNPNITPSAVLVRRDLLVASGGFDVTRQGCEDWELWFRLSRTGPFCVVPEPLTLYFVSNTGFSSDADRVFNDFQHMLDPLLLHDLHGIQKFIWRRRLIAYQASKAALTARGAGEYQKEWRYFEKSMAVWPSPFWYPERFKAMAVTLLRRMSLMPRAR